MKEEKKTKEKKKKRGLLFWSLETRGKVRRDKNTRGVPFSILFFFVFFLFFFLLHIFPFSRVHCCVRETLLGTGGDGPECVGRLGNAPGSTVPAEQNGSIVVSIEKTKT